MGTTDTNTKFHGGSAIISVYHPSVVGTQYSSGRIKVQNGPDSIEVGWTVSVKYEATLSYGCVCICIGVSINNC